MSKYTEITPADEGIKASRQDRQRAIDKKNPPSKIWSDQINDWLYRSFDRKGNVIYMSIPEGE